MQRKLTRKANVSPEQALKEIVSRFPNDRVEYPFPVENINGDKYYVAKFVTSEFPPKDDEPDPDGNEEASSDSDKPKPFDEKPKGEGEKKGDGGSNKKMLDLLEQIAGALGIDPSGGDDMGGDVPPPDNLDLPDVGAPPQGDTLPPPAQKHPGMGGPTGGPAFASKLPKSFTAFVEDADNMTIQDAVKEASVVFPSHRVAKANKARARYNGREQTIIQTTLIER